MNERQALHNILELAYSGHPDGRETRLELISRYCAQALEEKPVPAYTCPVCGATDSTEHLAACNYTDTRELEGTTQQAWLAGVRAAHLAALSRNDDGSLLDVIKEAADKCLQLAVTVDGQPRRARYEDLLLRFGLEVQARK